MTPIPGLHGCFWDDQGFFVRQVSRTASAQEVDAIVARDRQAEQYLVGSTRHWIGTLGILRLRYRLRLVEDVRDSAGQPTGETKETWAPKLSVLP